MRIRLLGTGSADGWPNPFCGCASCAAAAGEPRGNSGALVDGTLLLDFSADVPRTAARLGVDLRSVEAVLVTHAHPDHLAPAGLLWRGWTGTPGPIEIVGPAAVTAECTRWLGPDSPVLLRTVSTGDVLQLAGYDVRALTANHPAEAGPPLLWDIEGNGARLLYATDTGPLPEATWAAVAGAAYDIVLLECTGMTEHGHHDLAAFAQTLAGLRRCGAAVATTRVLATHVGHGNPAPVEVRRQLALLGAELAADGQELLVGEAATAPAADGQELRVSGAVAAQAGRARRVLITGGARSGKSAEAVRRLAGEPEVVFVATGPLADGEDPDWADRVAAHRADRPAAWTTLETVDVADLLLRDGPPLLVDCLSLWFSARFRDSPRARASALAELLAALRKTCREVVLVTNEVGSGVHPETALGRSWRDELGRLNQVVAAACDEVWLVVAGVAVQLR